MHRDANGARLIRDGARDSLPHPPGGVSGKFVAAPVIEFVHRFHQSDVAFLDQVQELQPAIGVALSYGDHQTQVRLDQLLLGGLGFLLAALDNLERAPKLGGTCSAFFFELLDALARLPEFFAQIARRPAAMRGLFELTLYPGDLALERL